MAETNDCRKDNGLFTLPNLISIARLLCVPVFLWLLFVDNSLGWAGVLLCFLGATDWIDGWIARRFDQGSEIGKVLDPVADRIMLITATLALVVYGTVPIWIGVAILVREIAVSLATLSLAAAGAARIDVQWSGKAGAFGVMLALPGFVIIDLLSAGLAQDTFIVLTAIAILGGLGFSYLSLFEYLPRARKALILGRQNKKRNPSINLPGSRKKASGDGIPR